MAKKSKRKRAASRWRTASDLDPGLHAAIMACEGRMYILAEKLGLTPQAISNWDKVPLNRVPDVERVTGVAREILRPDIFVRQPAKRPPVKRPPVQAAVR